MKDAFWKVALSAALSAMATFLVMWLTLASGTITRAEAQKMIGDATMAPMSRIEEKQDRMQESLDDVRERLARIEEHVTTDGRH